MTCVPEKVDLFQLNVEVWCDCGQGAEEQEGLLGAGQGFRAGGCSMGGGGGAQGRAAGRGSRSHRVWQSFLRMSAQQLPHGIPSKPGWVLWHRGEWDCSTVLCAHGPRLLHRPPARGRLGCFHGLARVNTAAANAGVHVSVEL